MDIRCPTSLLICLFIQWPQFIGLLGKSIHIYGSGRAVGNRDRRRLFASPFSELGQAGRGWRRCSWEWCLRCERRSLITRREGCCSVTAVSHREPQLVSAGTFSTCWELHSLSCLISVQFLGTGACTSVCGSPGFLQQQAAQTQQTDSTTSDWLTDILGFLVGFFFLLCFRVCVITSSAAPVAPRRAATV